MAKSLTPRLFQSLLWWICLFDYLKVGGCQQGRTFQSLLWWICLFDTDRQLPSIICSTVSILVMMDLSFWHGDRTTLAVSLALFQSLLWWICLFDLVKRLMKVDPDLLFQSLLWWICLFDLRMITALTSAEWVSILVMMDLSFWPWVAILSLMYLDSFNPCYDGFVFLTFRCRQLILKLII